MRWRAETTICLPVFQNLLSRQAASARANLITVAVRGSTVFQESASCTVFSDPRHGEARTSLESCFSPRAKEPAQISLETKRSMLNLDHRAPAQENSRQVQGSTEVSRQHERCKIILGPHAAFFTNRVLKSQGSDKPMHGSQNTALFYPQQLS